MFTSRYIALSTSRKITRPAIAAATRASCAAKPRICTLSGDSSVDFSNTDEEELAPSIIQEHTRASFHDDLSEPDMEVWALANFGLAKKFAYNIQEDLSNPTKPSLVPEEKRTKSADNKRCWQAIGWRTALRRSSGKRRSARAETR